MGRSRFPTSGLFETFGRAESSASFTIWREFLAALVALLACAATARFRALSYVALAAGIALPVTWLFRPPSDLWIGSNSYPHPAVEAPPFTRVAFLPAFQPLGLRAGGGDGADPDAHVYPGRVTTLNEYFPTYPVDMALARYEQSGDAQALRALSVAQIVPRPWLISLTQGRVGMAASSLQPRMPPAAASPVRYLAGATPLMSVCENPRIVRFSDRLGACDVFFGDAVQRAAVVPLIAASDSIDPQTAWIDARLAFAESPALAQAIGGVLTLSSLPHRVEPNSWLLAYVRGALLSASDTRVLQKSRGAFAWLRIPGGVSLVRCAGLCELVAQAPRLPSAPLRPSPVRVRAADFHRLAPWLYLVDAEFNTADRGNLLRFNERYDPSMDRFVGRARVAACPDRHVGERLVSRSIFGAHRRRTGHGTLTIDCRDLRCIERSVAAEGARARADEARLSDRENARSVRGFEGAVPSNSCGGRSSHPPSDGGSDVRSRPRRRDL